MEKFNYLKGLVVQDTHRVRTPSTKQPEGLAIRLMSNGAAYPSNELITKFNLEYQTQNDPRSNGFDVFDSEEWAAMKTQPRSLMIGVIPKTEPKVDLFGICRYDDSGNPRSTVTNQGSKCLTLLELARSFGYLNDEQKYVDLVVLTDYPVKTADGIAYIPKTITKGERAGEKTYQRRENAEFYMIVPTEILAEETENETPTENQEATTETTPAKPGDNL